MICVLFTLISGVILLQTSDGNLVEETGSGVTMQCRGSNLALNEPDSRTTVFQVYVFRGNESLASTKVAATRHFQDRLIVASDGRVTLENLSADDLGVYRVEVKLSDDRWIQRSLRLVVSEPPQTSSTRTLAVNTGFSSGSNSVRLTCGNFTSLGFPPVSAVWEDPLGHVLPSDGFKDQTFYLDLPLDTAEPGDYCCRLDCPAPTYCCLEERSPLTQCAQVHVQTRKAGATVKITDCVSLASFSQLQQQVLDVAGAVRLLQESERQDCSQSGVAAMAQLIQRQARCDQLDAYVSRVEALEARLTAGLDDVDQQFTDRDAETKRKLYDVQAAINNNLLMMKENISLRLSDLETAVIANLTQTGRALTTLELSAASQTSALEGNVSASWDSLTSHVTSTKQSLVDVRTTTDALKAGFCPMRKGYSWYGGRCLKFDKRTVDFQSAKANCLADGGHLLNIKSRDDAPLFRDAIRKVGVTVPSPSPGVFLHFWVGATDIATEGTFVWGDGTALPKSSPLWYQGEPNDVGGQEDCVQVYLDTTSMHLNDNTCTAQLHSFCEYD